MKQCLTLLTALVYLLCVPAVADGDRILGHWHPDPNAPAIVTVSKENDHYQGVLTHSPAAPERAGTVILRELHYDPAERHWRGQILAVRRNRVMDVIATQDRAEVLHLAVKTLFGTRNIKWHRVAEQ